MYRLGGTRDAVRKYPEEGALADFLTEDERPCLSLASFTY